MTAVAAACAAVAVAASPVWAVEQGQWWHDTWQMPQVWRTADGAGVTVAVIDTGVDASVSELDGAVIPGAEFLEHGDEGADGTVDRDPDGNGHGTAMASLIAGGGGDGGRFGVAPAATILPAVVTTAMSEGGEPLDQYSEAIRYVVDQGAHVINLSVGASYSPGQCPDRVATAVRYALSQDTVVVAGAGNTPGGDTDVPAACPGVLTVAAVGQSLDVWENSHRSPYVDVAAPAVEISMIGRDGQAVTGSGTSAASALVAGVVALVRGHYPDASADEVVARLIATAQDLGSPGRDDATGYGLVRPYQALTADLPAGIPNPVYDGVDLTDTADPGSSRDGFEPPPPPQAPQPPPPPQAGSGAVDPVPVLLLATGVLLLAATVVAAAVTYVVRSRRRSGPPGSSVGPPTPPG